MTNKERTDNYMSEVRNYLTEKYGKIEPHWEGQLTVLRNMFKTYLDATQRIEEDGICIADRYGVPKKHPMCDVAKDANNQMCKIIDHLGLSPFAKGKIKEVTDENDTDIIKGLLT